MTTYPRYRFNHRPKYGLTSKSILVNQMSFTGIIYKCKNGLKIAVSPSSPQHGLQIMKAQDLEHTGASQGSSTGWKMSFQAAQLV